MSFIHDALKKTQKNLKNIEKRSYSPIEKKGPEETPKDLSSKKTSSFVSFSKKNMLLRLLSVVVIIFIINQLRFSFKEETPHTKKISLKKIAAPSIIPKITRAQNPSPLILSGVMMIDGQYVALINDQIYKINDPLDDKRIIAISLEKVVLEGINKETITLLVGNKQSL